MRTPSEMLKSGLAQSGRPNTLRGYETASLPHLYAIRAGKGERLFDCRSVISRFAVVRESDAVFAIEDIDFIFKVFPVPGGPTSKI